MREIIYRCLNSNITFYIVVPLLLLVLGWIKDWYDKKAQQGITTFERPREKCPFFEVYILFVYQLQVVFFIGLIFLITIEACGIKTAIQYRIIAFFRISFLGLICLKENLKKEKYRLEMLKNGKGKIVYCVFTEIVCFMNIFICDKKFCPFILYGSMFIVGIFAYVCSDHIIIYDNKYLSLVLNNGDEIKDIQIDKIKSKKNTLIVDKSKDDEKRIVQIDKLFITRINYYGEEYMKVYCPIFKWFKLEISEEELMELEKEMSEDK